jgi:hypothetical protein
MSPKIWDYKSNQFLNIKSCRLVFLRFLGFQNTVKKRRSRHFSIFFLVLRKKVCREETQKPIFFSLFT